GGFQCIEDTCQYVTDSQVLGGACDELKKCASGTVCQNGKCMTPGKEGDACDEEQLTTCAAGMMCVLGQCIPVSGECQKSEDCTEKDSYCCQSETCGAIGHCIPYDDNTTHDAMCLFKTKPGIFEAQIQCRWQPPSDATPTSTKVEMMPLVGKFGNKAGLETAIAFYSYKSENGPDDTVIRIIHPETCETLESITLRMEDRWHNYPAAADLDGDGFMEIIVRAYDSAVPVAYKWNAETQKHEQMWKGDKAGYGYNMMVYDLDNDGKPEVIAGTAVYDGQTGKLISGHLYGSSTNADYGMSNAIGNFDLNPEGIAWMQAGGKVYKWNVTNRVWDLKHTLYSASNYQNHNAAYADFGTPGATAEEFDYTKLDGKPEFVFSGSAKLHLYALIEKEDGTYTHQKLMDVKGFKVGGPITVGDFDNDGLPEIALASQALFGVYDPRCEKYEAGKCADKHVLWERWSQDGSSGRTGSSLFDFDGDGQAEAVYADECYTRVYDGKTGRVLFSAPRSSSTSIEGPVIADVDDDGSSEILMGSDNSYSCYNDGSTGKVNAGVDPIHEGIRCMDDEDCPTSKNCDKELGLCLCTDDNDCNTQYIGGKIFKQYTCTAPIHENVGFMHNPTDAAERTEIKARGQRPDGWDSSTGYKVCRAYRNVNSSARQAGISDLMIYKDRLDRWVSSRNIWNQHSYNIINIEDNGRVPDAKTWKDNWLLKKVGEYITGSTTQERPVYNNYRMNEQGLYGAGTVPDITGRFILGNICGETDDGRKVISGKLCNRGTKPVATNLPATFFYYDEAAPEGRGEKICTSYTPGIVGVGECQQVGCTVEESVFEGLQGKKVL
ncbi:MAG: VCBS repeat-containing protein, partial [Proteobacteria bacterium]|nr:VCBS repeat-containing protein [Pseudomonadota bacterium]